MTTKFDIAHMVTRSDDDWAWMTEGHVDLEAFEAACRENHPDAPDTPPLHCWVRATGDGVDEGGDPRVDFCDAHADGARPVTAIVAYEFWDKADALS